MLSKYNSLISTSCKLHTCVVAHHDVRTFTGHHGSTRILTDCKQNLPVASRIDFPIPVQVKNKIVMKNVSQSSRRQILKRDIIKRDVDTTKVVKVSWK